jgi:allantoin racemase
MTTSPATTTICVINPNSSETMTAHLERTLDEVRAPTTRLRVVRAPDGPPSIESAFDEAQAIPPMLRLVASAETDGCDAIVIACFADPGLHAAREIASIPVVGMEEAALHVAAMLGHRFTILTTRAARVPAKRDHVAALGLEARLASIRPLGMGVLELDAEPARAEARIMDVGRAAVEEDGAEVLVLGCAGLAGYGRQLTATFGAAVVDPATVALKIAESLAVLRLAHSKRGLYRRTGVSERAQRC